MPSATARRMYEDQIPSFMSVFDLDPETISDRDTVTVVDPKLVGMEPAKELPTGSQSQQPRLHPAGIPTDPIHRHHDSTSTQMSESADSSPTTTLSTTDSSPLSDPSPSSSPDSPINALPLTNFAPASFTLPSITSTTLTVPEALTLERPMTSPSPRRARNMKGLSIQPPVVASPAQCLVSEPCSPSFIKPAIPAMKRKPSHLSLKTSTSDLVSKRTLEVPQSPGMPPILQRRALKHSTSSPHMLSSLRSSTFGPAGGMTFPKVLERNESGLSELLRPMKSSMKATFDSAITEEDSPIKMQMANRGEFEPYNDSGDKEDQKSPGYPEGPIAIYGDDVYLYLEPNAEEASRFDVVINVAREVRNPFPDRRSRDLSAFADSLAAIGNLPTAMESQSPDDKDTPTTPKANPLSRPEYIHIPWDHNTDIAPDLMRLCEIIDNRTKDGKKVLIHCQQGASRSASLIIAYGLYQKPELSVNDAYYAAQAKSRWISPNMKLMYSLQDFQKEVSKKRLSPASAYRPRAGRSPTKHRLTLSVDAIDISPKEPHTAPLPGEEEMGSKENVASPTQTRLRGNSTPGRPDISPGPASAPMTFSWNEKEVTQTKPSEFLAPFNPRDLPQRPKTGQASGASNPPRLGESWMKPAPSGFGFSEAPSGFGFSETSLSFRVPEAPCAPSGFGFTETPLPFRVPEAPSAPSGFGFTETPLPFRVPEAPSAPSGFGSSDGFGFQSLRLPRQRDEGNHKAATANVLPPIPVQLATVMPDDDALMSPRAEMMTNNPLHEVDGLNSMRFVEAPTMTSESLFSPRATSFPRESFIAFGLPRQVSDPRSPPTKGEAPIIRSIDDIL